MRSALMLLLLAAGLTVGCSRHEGGDAKPGKAAASAPAARELAEADVVVAKAGALADMLPFTGTLSAPSSASIAAEVEARVKEVRVREGERVSKGQVLAVLDAEALDQSVSEQEAQLANNRSRLQLAKIKLDKQRELLQKGFISQLAFDEVQSDYTVRAGELKAQETQLARARRLQADSVVKAPIDGVVYERKINPGEVAAKNAKLFSVADLRELEVSASVPSQRVALVKPGMTARFTVEGQAQAYSGLVARINPVAQSGTRSFTVFIRVENPDGRLKGGLFAKGGIVLSEIAGQTLLPQNAVQDPEGKPWVMAIEKGRLVKRPVRIALLSETERVAAVSGVSPGEPVLAARLLGVNAGEAVSLPPSVR